MREQWRACRLDRRFKCNLHHFMMYYLCRMLSLFAYGFFDVKHVPVSAVVCNMQQIVKIIMQEPHYPESTLKFLRVGAIGHAGI